ncbi:MAG: RNA 2',3'-cyclic phosphodiesterase [Pirellulales bacterium]|nr:RNA 2',3'-cyclic phosphodiesterase [Pirellulales bacterium]
MGQTVRAFVAIETTPAVKSAIGGLIETLRSVGTDVKWVEPHNLHLTVKFLGDVTLTETARVCQAVARAAAEVEPFALEIVGVGAFPNAARPRTLWLGARCDGPAMIALHKQVENRLQKLGFRKDGRPFRAHLTLGRVRRAGPGMAALAELLEKHAGFAAGAVGVRELIVFSSQLSPTGPTYTPLGRAPLGT